MVQRAYDPTSWALILQANNDLQVLSASLVDSCDLDKLIYTITDTLAEGSSKLVARLTAGSVNQIPNGVSKFLGGNNCYEKMIGAGNLAQVAFAYYIN